MFLEISSKLKSGTTFGIGFILVLGLFTLMVFYYMGAYIMSDILSKTKDDIVDDKVCIKIKDENSLNYAKLFINLVWIMLALRIIFMIFKKYFSKFY